LDYKKRVNNPGENAEALQTSLQNNTQQEQNILPNELIKNSNAND
jgi:hypothetical protein